MSPTETGLDPDSLQRRVRSIQAGADRPRRERAARSRTGTAPDGAAGRDVAAPAPNGASGTAGGRTLSVRGLTAHYGDHLAVKGVDLDFRPGEVTAIIGPSGCGKSTMVRCVNRMHEEIEGARSSGRVTLDGEDLYGPGVDVVAVRRAVGMVFQRPNPFPTMSVFDNVAAGLRFTRTPRAELQRRVTGALEEAGLLEEVKDRLSAPGGSLSGGQQQRLCIARALAVEPQVILMDEPCSALDPVATLRIEDLIARLKERVTIAIVTHNMQQAGRVADTTAFMLDGEMVEVGPTEALFTSPGDERTERYVTGKFG